MTLTKLEIKELSRITKEEWNEFTKTVWQIANVSDAAHPAAFPEEIPHRLMKMFSLWGETVLDPFSGTGTTGIAALKNGRKAICVEQNPSYVEVTQERIAGFENAADATLVSGDACHMDIVENDSIGLIITSPPYWDKADYGDNACNLGARTGYKEFLRRITPTFQECFRVLMPGRKLALVTANVNQHTNHGLLTFPLAADFIYLLRDIGFLVVSEIIWNKNGTGGKWGSSGRQRPIFGSYPYPPNLLFKNVHEHILIFAKPCRGNTTGPKVRNYEELMELPMHQNAGGHDG